ncbi:WD repeat-containing protein 7-like isoform X2 [Daphnia pulex]|uniref:WD repeat-containing protein 7-like isoform X2 n=1 Tax=Daphnia pulex TaxID=6669 RepID=UPI001EDFA7B2|nr:WD repeat-containing protein 7-like isoform X2 [Daphnia pulex]XP_046440939.1 WD repeat-containing protein 7-like isoform X2 [Daphnia pulex]XP_046440940.1 WD repeat-containing protein 7-like isoform X2 [Daphnia pulex]
MAGPTSPHLVIPLMLWGESSPSHCISAIQISHDHCTLVTGSHDGQLCVWVMDPNTYKATPKCLLVGHTASIVCLVAAKNTLEMECIVSSSENGEMCTWDLIDGQCIESVKLPQIHSHIQSYSFGGTEDASLFCIGNYPEILVIDPFTLEIIMNLTSRVHPDWMAAIHVLRPTRRQDDVVLGLTTSGVVKVWTVGAQDLNNLGEPVLEHESKQIRCLSATSMTCCLYNQRTVIIVSPKYWQIYDAGDFSLLCSMASRQGESWVGGDFLATDRVIVWNNAGTGFIYRLPTNCVVESKDFHNKSSEEDFPFLYCVLKLADEQKFPCPPSIRCSLVVKGDGRLVKLLLRGDANGRVSVFSIPEVTDNQLEQIQQLDFDNPPIMNPQSCSSLADAWDAIYPKPVGVLSHVDNNISVTASLYITTQNRLVCGRADGSIVLVNGLATLKSLLLQQSQNDLQNMLTLEGHTSRVTCLLYPYQLHTRYDPVQLVSGGADFTLCLWDISSGTLLQKFCVQVGEIAQLLVPPANSSPRILQCICSVAKDHSVSLISLKERKCVLLASRHLFPVTCIKWRPLDDFMMVACSDGTLYVWQMETGQLDRVVHGMSAEEILNACDESVSIVPSFQEGGLANPAVHFFRGLKHRNISAIRHAALRGLNQLQHASASGHHDSGDHAKDRGVPLTIQGLRSNASEKEFHAVFFDAEALVVQLLHEEYSLMSPNTLETHGLINQSEYQKVAALTHSASPDAQKKIADFLGKVKDKAGDMERRLKDKDKHGILAKVRESAENMQHKIQSRSDAGASVRSSERGAEDDGLSNNENVRQRQIPHTLPNDWSLTMEIAQLLLSLLHGWTLDKDLDHACQNRLGLAKPKSPVCFGLISRSGHMMLMLPTWPAGEPVDHFTSFGHWAISSTLTTNHLLAIVALSNTLMSMNSAAFTDGKIIRQFPPREIARSSEDRKGEESSMVLDVQTKQGWSLMATLHCVLLPDKVQELQLLHNSSVLEVFRKAQIEMLARRWQDRCLEIREAAQALLLAELERVGVDGRKSLVDKWATFLPTYADPFTIIGSSLSVGSNAANLTGSGTQNLSIPSQQWGSDGSSPARPTGEYEAEEDHDDEDDGEDVALRRPNRSMELKRRQATSVVLLGVIGAEFGQDVGENKRTGEADPRKKKTVEGFGLGPNQNLARLTSKALTYLLLAPATPKLPLHTSLRRAAIDLIGRGFTVWEPHLDVSKVLLSMLELCCEGDKLIPSMSYGLPLSPAADSCRTSRHALTLIATARPAAFITTMAREVARYITLQQNAQALNVNLANTTLARAKPEILRVIELLIDKMQADISDLLVEVTDIVLHCVDHGHLKGRSLSEVFPSLCRFSQITHCSSSRRIAVGSRNGSLALYELRGQKCQYIQAHNAEITACAFSPDGKNLASYSSTENRLSFWQQSATGVFGLGAVQTRCVKTYTTDPVPQCVRPGSTIPLRMARLQWHSGKTVAIMLSDGSETRYHL